MTDHPSVQPDQARDLAGRRSALRTNMGGTARVAALRDQGARTAREWIEGLVDSGSFQEIGLFAGQAGEGRLGGHGQLAGRPISVCADDVTVKAGTDSRLGTRKVERVYGGALEARHPFVYVGQSAGSRVPDILGSQRMAQERGLGVAPLRRRIVPMATAIVGRSYGKSSFLAAMSDFVVQQRGAVMAVTSPRVIEVATQEQVDEAELGGADLHAEVTGQVDLAVDTADEVIEAIRRFLSYLPDHGGMVAPRIATRDGQPDRLEALVPAERRRGYDMRKVIAALADGGDLFEIKPRFGRSVITALTRLDGRAVGVVANQPMQLGGAITPEACEKVARFVCLCDAFNLPLVFLADTPGFLVGTQVERNRLLSKAVMLNQALALARVPRFSVVLRKAYGLAYFSMSGGDTGAQQRFGWPTAEISFMDPEVAANVLHGGELAGLDTEARKRRIGEIAADLSRATTAFDAASDLGLDDIIAPHETRAALAAALDRHMTHYDPIQTSSVLAAWPTCF